MWSRERHKRILSVLETKGKISANDLASMLGVSRETVRRDLVELGAEGLITRVHGGALLSQAQTEPPFRKRQVEQIRAKRDIARKAAGLVLPGQTILVDAGTTTSVFAHELAKISGITVITNSIDIATTVQSAETKIDLILLGGGIISDVPATYGELTLAEIRRFHVDLTFVAPVALDSEKGAFDFDLHEASVAGAMMEQASESVLLVDHTKLGKVSRVKYCDPGQIDMLVTDTPVHDPVLRPFQDWGMRIVV
ncbi:DeoR family transcriptional regulator [Halomonas aestuarii]|uniref:DeoR family transcriptional regulator n=1 Tax=Halomonas aestuarii TaxID=1897729 RepID=A0A1J0VGA4_9GAMM|nr:DeoR/GlpR family DNA-binding transcription regulator [Halomonas aestuarii]APE31034.1 DeoR family transcriptional regulator [Halomonas aestuarii]